MRQGKDHSQNCSHATESDASHHETSHILLGPGLGVRESVFASARGLYLDVSMLRQSKNRASEFLYSALAADRLFGHGYIHIVVAELFFPSVAPRAVCVAGGG